MRHDIPVLRPQLPPADWLLPYLRRIDATRIYSNHGPLVQELEGRLAGALALPSGGLASASTGTAALVGAILATAGRATEARPCALVPAYTFVATAFAAEECGYQIRLADVDANSWMLNPEQLARDPMLADVGMVIPVAPFGRPVPLAPWLAFREQTSIPVVIDGAASFDRIAEQPRQFLGAIPVALSFHATKAFGTGEGGCVASTDADLMPRVAQALNFGFLRARDAEDTGINGKMSEYHAAVGLAELDGWAEKRRALQAVADQYRGAMRAEGLAARFIGAPDVGLTYVLFRCDNSGEAQRVRDWLMHEGIDTRLWYGKGLHTQTCYAALPHDALPVTDALAPCLLGLPLAPDLTTAQIGRVTRALAAALAAPRSMVLGANTHADRMRV
jgi:dTDP-4-amino-4,6-dideoxygalactose transaminase